MSGKWGLVAFLCVALGGQRLVAAAPAEKGGPDPSIERLVEQLGDSDFRQRDRAAALLKDLGPAALPSLRPARTHPDPEVRRRLEELIVGLELNAQLAPRRVTLDLHKKPVREVLAEISSQTGYKIECFNAKNENQPYDFHFDRVPFWEALEQVCQACQFAPQPSYGDMVLRLQPQEKYIPYVCTDGGFRVVAGGFQQNRTVNFGTLPNFLGGPQRANSLTLTFGVFAEPKLPLLGLGEPHLDAALDEEGNSMIPPPLNPNERPFGMVSRFGNGFRTLFQQGQLTLARPSEKARSVKLIKGTMPVNLLIEEKLEVVTDQVLSAKGKKFKVADTNFTIHEVGETPAKQPQIRMTISDESKDASNDYTWVNSLYNRIELQDEKGVKLQVQGSSWGNSSPRSVDITLTFAPTGGANAKPKMLLFHHWSTLQTQVVFLFKDLPLP